MTDSRKHLRDLIAAIAPHDRVEESHIQQALEWIDSGAPLYRVTKPATPPIHLVAYFIVVDLDCEKTLLGYHLGAQCWLPPGGHIEPEENPLLAAKRECQEELFFEPVFFQNEPLFLTYRETLGPNTPKHIDVSLWYAVLRSSLLDLKFDEREFSEMQWCSFDSVESHQGDPHLGRFLAKLQSKEKA